MDMEKQEMKKIKFFASLRQECQWLEEMAVQGWFFKNITWGSLYTFERGEPKNMMYEVDRFNLPKKPTLEEIRSKELFMDMAEEMGWSEVTHDEMLNYYFCKEYEEGEINELYNDETSRKQRASKYPAYFQKKAKEAVFWGDILVLLDIIIRIWSIFMPELKMPWYDAFVLVYVLASNTLAQYCWSLGARMEAELLLSRSEWEAKQKSTDKTVRKLIFTIRGLNRFLRKEEEQGYLLTGVTLTKYFFVKKETSRQIYTMDSKWLTNKRQKERQGERFQDKKDKMGLNNDWQVQSLKDAESRGWQFVCALENRVVIYRGDAERAEPLNDAKYDNSMRGISLVGDYGLTVIMAGLLGGIVGFILAWFDII